MISPPTHVVRGLGLDVDGLRPLHGGQGRSWYDGTIVIKPVDNVDEQAWVSDVFAGWTHHDVVRVPEPVAAPDGTWVYDGWAAHRYLAGVSASMRTDTDAIRSASDDFHAVVASTPSPAFIDRRDDPWAIGDRIAWDNAEPVGELPTRLLIEDLQAAMAPVGAHSQVIHGDVGGNVLLAPGLPPAVIDWPPYFRTVGFAWAVAVADALCWEGLPLGQLDRWNDIPEWDQLLVRALAYRIGTTGRREAIGQAAISSDEHAARVRPVIDAVLDRLDGP